MKKFTFTLLLALLSITLVKANDPAYLDAMKKQIDSMNSISSIEDAQNSKNGFLRISAAKPTEWLPLYYAALTQTNAAFRFDVAKDTYFDEALAIIKKAESLDPNNSEITALHGFIIMGKLSVDPASRGQALSPQAMQLFSKAIKLNKQNPRATMLMGQMELGMSQFFGTGPEKACGMGRIALDLFEKEHALISGDYILPTWGKNQAEELTSACK